MDACKHQRSSQRESPTAVFTDIAVSEPAELSVPFEAMSSTLNQNNA